MTQDSNYDANQDTNLQKTSLAERLNMQSVFSPIVPPVYLPVDLTGTDGGNNLKATQGGDFIYGLGGDDIIESGGGADEIDGGQGSDTASYA